MRSLFLYLTIFFSVQATASLAASDKDNGLKELISIALEQNNEILSAESRVIEATERIRQAGTLPDPQLGFEYFLEPIETRTGPQEASVSLRQSFPWLGRLSLEKELKENDVGIAKALLIKTRFSVIRKIKEAYIEYGYLGQAEKITTQILELMNYLEGIANTNYTSGKASYADVLKIQIEIDKLRNKKISLADNTTPFRTRINNILGTDRNMARQQPDNLPQLSLGKTEEDIFELFRLYNPVILAGQHKVNGSRTSLDIAEQGYYPDLTMSVKTIFTGEAEFGNPPDSGQDPVIAGFSINIPLFFDRRNGAIAEKQASIRTSQTELKELTNVLESEIEMILFRYREAERLMGLYNESLIPKVRQELDVALEAFQGGEYSILELIDAEKNWLNFELAKIRAQADMAIQLAKLEELTGTTLADWNQNK